MKAELLEFITTEILGGQAGIELQAEDDLLTSGIIDSMGVMRMIVFIEEKSNLKIPPEDITLENFITVDSICRYLSQRDAS